MQDDILYKLLELKNFEEASREPVEPPSAEGTAKQCILCTRPQRQLRFFDHTKPRMVVPTSLKAFILYKHHGLPIAGHDRRKRVFATLAP